MSLSKLEGFYIGNVVGMAILIIGIVVTAPQKLKEQEKIDEAKKVINVVVVTTDVKAGHKLKESEVRALSIEKGKAPAGSLLSFEQAIDRRLVSDVVSGSILRQSDLVSEEQVKPEKTSSAGTSGIEPVTTDQAVSKSGETATRQKSDRARERKSGQQ